MYKINEIVNNFLLSGDKCISEMHLKQELKERIEKFMQAENTDFIYKN